MTDDYAAVAERLCFEFAEQHTETAITAAVIKAHAELRRTGSSDAELLYLYVQRRLQHLPPTRGTR